MTYKETEFTIDRQRQQTMAVVHFVMETVTKYISPDDRKYALRELFEALDKAGVEIITAENRAAANLPPRSPKGWTYQELQIMEAKRIEAMLSPMPRLIMTTLAAEPSEVTRNEHNQGDKTFQVFDFKP